MKTIYNRNGCILKADNLFNQSLEFAGFQKALWKELSSLNYIKEFGRLVSYQGDKDIDYIYTRTHHKANGWTSHIESTTQLIRQYLQSDDRDNYFNHCLINQYLPDMSLNRHKDDEPELIDAIASLSLGDSAYFIYGNEYNKLRLDNGDVLIGNRKFFNTMHHAVSKPIDIGVGKRFNLTWRTVNPIDSDIMRIIHK